MARITMSRIAKGATTGCIYWLVYGTVETALSVGIQLFRNPEMSVLPWQWRLIAMVFGVYALAGAVLGGIAAAILPEPQTIAAFTVVLVFEVNLIRVWPLDPASLFALGMGFLIVAALLLSRLNDRLRNQMQAFAGPFTLSLLLLVSPWLSREVFGPEWSSALKFSLSLCLPLFIAVVVRLKWRQREYTLAPLRTAIAAILLLTVFITGAAIRSRPPVLRAASSAVPANASGKPNILLVTMDAVRADHTSLYGYQRDTTPRLREFAQSATLYTRTAATSDYTFPTHASIFTGLYPDWPRTTGGDVLPSDVPILAQVLGANGYSTAECVANYGFLGPQAGLARGFGASDWRRAVFLSTEEALIQARKRPYYLRHGAIMLLGRVTNGDYFFRRTRSAADINECALALLDQANQSRPFFAFVNYMDAHADYVSDAPFAYLFPGRDRRFSASSYRRLKAEVNSGKRALQPWERAHLISQYDGGIAAIDAAVDELIKKLRALGVFDQTLVIILADHGEAFAERGLLEHDLNSVHQELISVPMLIKYPNQHEGKRFDEWVSQVDLMPTMLGLAGIASPGKLEGRSLMQEASKPMAVFAETSGYNGPRRTILSGSTKLIFSGNASPELYDLASDPEEVRNLYSKDNPHVAELEQQLHRWIASRPQRKAQPQKLDPAAVERLKSLGYVQ